MPRTAPLPKRKRVAHGAGGAQGSPKFPWQDYREIALGWLGWPPSEFWGATVCDLIDAWEGHCVASGRKKKFRASDYPDEEGRKQLKARLERERGDA